MLTVTRGIIVVEGDHVACQTTIAGGLEVAGGAGQLLSVAGPDGNGVPGPGGYQW